MQTSPWRAPGSSPVLDSCGMAGGTPASGIKINAFSTTEHTNKKTKNMAGGTPASGIKSIAFSTTEIIFFTELNTTDYCTPVQVATAQCTRRPPTQSRATWGASCPERKPLLSGPLVRRSLLPGPYRSLRCTC